MKNGKPEVLIIGERHPSMILKGKGGPKTIRDMDENLPDVRRASKIIRKEIELINNFKPQKILFEWAHDEKFEQELLEFLKNKNFAGFEKRMAEDASENGVGLLLPSHEAAIAQRRVAKIILFLIMATNILNIGFYEDQVSFHNADNATREAKAIENLKKMLLERTVIICGADHLNSIAHGLKDVANVKVETSRGD